MNFSTKTLLRYLGILTISVIVVGVFAIADRIYYGDRLPFLAPLEGRLVIRSDSMGNGKFGMPRNNGRVHRGIDLAAAVGAPVRASRAGWAISEWDTDGLGKYVKVSHRDGLVTVYGHLSKVSIGSRQRIPQGYIIGATGATGNACYPGIMPHLHFEIRKNGKPIDPLKGYLNEQIAGFPYTKK